MCYIFWEHDRMSEKKDGTKSAIINKQLTKQTTTMKSKGKGKGGKKGC